MDADDLKLRLLTNKLPLYVDNSLPIYSPKLIDIADIGVQKYQYNLSRCTIDKNSIASELDEGISDYDILLGILFHQEDALSGFLDSLYFFTKLNFTISEQNNDLLFFCGDISLNRNNYQEFVRLVKFVNCIKNNQPEKELDEFDRRVLEAEKQIAEIESKNGIHVPFKDLVSSVANMGDNNLNILNIWDINIFSFYEQMKRGQLKEAYFIGLKQLLAGADSKDVDLKYYIQKTD